MKQKVVLITGTSTGFGKLTAETLSKNGYRVIASMRDIHGKNAAPATELSKLRDVKVIELDVTNDRSVQEAVKEIESHYGTIDVLVNNAGIAGSGVMEAYSIERIKQMYDINVFGVFRMYQAVLPMMRKANKGLIINLSSFVGLFSSPYLVPYNSTKFALEAISEGMQGELKQFNIENVSIISGAYPTEMNTGAKAGLTADKPEVTEQYGDVARTDMEAFGTTLGGQMGRNVPQDMADAILKLIELPEGKRPLRYPLDQIAEGKDHAYIEGTKSLKNDWAEKYGVTIKH